MSCCSSMMSKWKMDTHCDVDLESLIGFGNKKIEKKTEDSITLEEKGNITEDLVAENTVPSNNEEKDTIVNELDEFLKEVVETVKNTVLSCRTVEVEQGVIGQWKNKGRKNVINEKPQCDNLAEIINSELKHELSNVNLNSEEPVAVEKDSNEISDTSRPLSNCTERNGTTATDIVEIREPIEDESKKVNFIHSENENREDDDLHLFNSYNYWYISPDMPLDSSIIAGEQSPKVENCFGDVGVSNCVFHFVCFAEAYVPLVVHLQLYYSVKLSKKKKLLDIIFGVSRLSTSGTEILDLISWFICNMTFFGK